MGEHKFSRKWRGKLSNQYIDRLTKIFLDINQDSLGKAENEEKRVILATTLSRLNSLTALTSPMAFVPEPIPTPRAIKTMEGYYGPFAPTPVPFTYSYNDALNFFKQSNGVRFYFGLDDHNNLIVFLCACFSYDDWGSGNAQDIPPLCIYRGREVTKSTQPNISDLKKMVDTYKKSSVLGNYISRAVYLSQAELLDYTSGVNSSNASTVQIYFGIVPDGEGLDGVGQLTIVLAWGDSHGQPIESTRIIYDNQGKPMPVIYDDNGTLYPPGNLSSQNSIFYL